MHHKVQPSFLPEYFIQPHPFYLCSLSQVRLQFPAFLLTFLIQVSLLLACSFPYTQNSASCFGVFPGIIQRALKTNKQTNVTNSWVLPLDLIVLGCSMGTRIFQSPAGNSNMQLDLRTIEMSHLPNNIYIKSSQNIGVALNYLK